MGRQEGDGQVVNKGAATRPGDGAPRARWPSGEQGGGDEARRWGAKSEMAK
jgi:hypothetical protein